MLRACLKVDKGTLRASGYVNMLPKGAEIGYRAPYAADIELGSPERPITGTQIVKVRSFRRKDGTIVKAHEKRYVNKRLIKFRPRLSKAEFGKPMFRVIDKIAEKRPQLFLTRALREGLKSLPEDIAFALNRVGRVEVR